MENIFNRQILYTELYVKMVLVTGASGMLASYLVFFLIWLNEKQGAGIRILALVRDRDRLRARFGRYCDREYFICIIADVCDFKETEEDIDYIVHAASPAMPTAYKKIPVEVASPNVIGLYNLLRIAVSKNVKGFLFFSSGDIYGKMPEGTGIFSEKNIGTMDPLDIHSCYGESKRMGETFIKCFAVEYGLDACSVRIGHTYAPTMDLKNDPRVFASFMKCAVERKDIIMLSDGSAKRPFCYIADAVAAFIILFIKGAKYMTLNELMQHPQFSNALQTFYWLQEWGDAHRCDKKRDRLLISDILKGDPRWEHITDNEHIGEVHKDIGYLIAHGFPWFATMCNLPIYVVFDHADKEHNGLYRLASYYCLE